MRSVDISKLNLRQKIFQRCFCYPPPGIDSASIEHDDTFIAESIRLNYVKYHFSDFVESIQNRVVLDVGCGFGYQVIGAAKEGAKTAIGTERRPIFEKGIAIAENLGIKDRVHFTLSPLKELGADSIDVALSLNSFEHYNEPDKILNEVQYVLKSGGRFFISFSPPWLHPFGVHMFFMIKYPWPHLIFSEKTIMKVRKIYKDDNAETFKEADGGLNRMTIKKFKSLVSDSGFVFEKLSLRPIMGVPLVSRIPVLSEFITSSVSAVLVKR